MKLIMAALDDLILQIKDPELRERIQKEADSLLKQKKFLNIYPIIVVYSI